MAFTVCLFKHFSKMRPTFAFSTAHYINLRHLIICSRYLYRFVTILANQFGQWRTQKFFRGGCLTQNAKILTSLSDNFILFDSLTVFLIYTFLLIYK